MTAVVVRDDDGFVEAEEKSATVFSSQLNID